MCWTKHNGGTQEEEINSACELRKTGKERPAPGSKEQRECIGTWNNTWRTWNQEVEYNFDLEELQVRRSETPQSAYGQLIEGFVSQPH